MTADEHSILAPDGQPPKRHPLVYELNTRCWLGELAARSGEWVGLGNVPETEFEFWQRLGFTHVWLMGVWRTGPRGREFSRTQPQVRRTAANLLPDWREEDLLASPYAVAAYEVPPELGGDEALRRFRRRLAEHGLGLLLDFIPNHLGLDHAWLRTRPELFVQSRSKVPNTFEQRSAAARLWVAHGKDPYFEAWADTAQLEHRNPATRAALLEELQSVARRCDGVRCDMAMLVMNEVFAKTWQKFPVSYGPSGTEFWTDAIGAVRSIEPNFLFLAEVYWGMEEQLQSLGFDFTYDKTLYDDLVFHQGRGVPQRVRERSREFWERSTHFLENHDEPRIASLLPAIEHRPAALLTLGLPGMRLLHEGQLTGALKRASVHLGRRPKESAQPGITAFYQHLLLTLQTTAIGRGDFRLLHPTPAWKGNATHEDFVLVRWQSAPPQFDLVVVNLAAHRSQCYVNLSVHPLAGHGWQMRDLLGEEDFLREGRELEQRGLYLDVEGHGAQLFHFSPMILEGL